MLDAGRVAVACTPPTIRAFCNAGHKGSSRRTVISALKHAGRSCHVYETVVSISRAGS
jgi:hypothetical protein